MTLTELQKEIFEINKANGWHDKVPSKLEQHALFHTEITEAYNEFISGKLETWYQPDGKPEGFYTELADVVIRILDYFSLEGIEYFNNGRFEYRVCKSELNFILSLHRLISQATEKVRLNRIGVEMERLYDIIPFIEVFLDANNQSLTDLITEKIAYNKTRGHRHGGKTI